MTLKLITGPATEPVTLAEAKAQMRVDASDEDDLISALITVAREEAEHRTERALITQTWERVIDAFPEVEIVLGKAPVQSITSITYTNTDGVETVIDGADYVLDNIQLPNFVAPADGVSWPATMDTMNAVKVRFSAGYGAASDVPMAIRQWMLLRIGTLYKFRESVIAGMPVAEMPGRFWDRLLDAYDLHGI